MSDPFPFPERQILTLFKELEGFCTPESCKGDLDKAAARTKVRVAMRVHMRPMWAALVERKLLSKGGRYSVPLDRPKIEDESFAFIRQRTDDAHPLAWLKPTEYDRPVFDFRLMLQSMFCYTCEKLETELVAPAPHHGRNTDPLVQKVQNGIADYFLAWLDTCKHDRAAQMREVIVGKTQYEAKPSPMVGRSQDYKRPSLVEKTKRGRERPRAVLKPGARE
jgi:hypothetical protein